MKIVHAADLHVDSPLTGLVRYQGAPVEQIRGATRRAFENLMQLCLDEEAKLLVLAGDLFDGEWKDYTTGLFFIGQLQRLKTAGTQVVLIRGNHDAASVVTRHLTLPSHVTELGATAPETKRFDDLGVAVHGQSYAERAEYKNLAASYPDALPGCLNIGLLHTCLTGRVGHEPYAPCGLDVLLAKNYDYWALGHVHEREVLHQDPWVVFPGNLQGRHMQETGAKGATLIHTSGQRITQVEHRVLDVVRFWVCDFTAQLSHDAEEIVEAVARRLETEALAVHPRLLACRVIVRGGTRAHRAFQLETERYEAELRSRVAEYSNVWVQSVWFRTQPEADPEALLGRGDALGQVARRFSQLQTDDAELAALLPLFEELRAKLPPEVSTGPEGVKLHDPDELKASLRDVQHAVLTRLLELHESG